MNSHVEGETNRNKVVQNGNDDARQWIDYNGFIIWYWCCVSTRNGIKRRKKKRNKKGLGRSLPRLPQRRSEERVTMALRMLNPNAVSNKGNQAVALNIGAARGLQEVLKSNLGPKGTLKM